MSEPLGVSENQRGEVLATDYVRSLSTGGGKPGAGYPAVMVEEPTAFHATQDPISDADAPRLGASASLGVQQGLTVRRLTPLERERLMGWPDGWTAWGTDEQGARVDMSDTVRDRMTGNGVVMPKAAWLAERIKEAS